VNKNDIVEVVIEDMGVNGEGIGKVDGYTLFIKDAIIGDYVRAKITKANKNFGFARLSGIISESEYRVKARCPVARPCGGCQIQEMCYEKQLEFKENKVRSNLKKIGGFQEERLAKVMEPIIGMEHPFNYRNKGSFPVGQDKFGEIVTGFYAGRTHKIIPNTDCVLGVEVNKVVLETVVSYMKENNVSPYDEGNKKGAIRHILIRYGFTTKEIMVCLVINHKSKECLTNGYKLVEKLEKIAGMTSIVVNCNTKDTNVIMGEKVEVLWGKGYITDYIEDIEYRISPHSFFQINPLQTKKLYNLVMEYADLKGREQVWDLYCGIGTISLFLSKKAKRVIGVEVAPQAIEDAKINAKINNIENVEFITGKAEEVLPKHFGKQSSMVYERPDIIVVDPPRKGCDKALLETIIATKPQKIIYVSCDSATMARDVKHLCDGGYQLQKVRPVDMFPMTVSVESVACLSRD